MKASRIWLTLAGGSAGYTSWLAFRPLTQEEKGSWNAIYMEDQSTMLRIYRRLPLNALSRLWGRCHHAELPPSFRRPAYTLYARLFGCNLSEAVGGDDLGRYRNLSEFFRRPLLPGARPVGSDPGLVCPADGTVLCLGRASPDGRLEQVKGVSYTLQGFLGPEPAIADSIAAAPELPTSSKRIPDAQFYSQLRSRPPAEGSHLYHCVIYLAPGDYHRFHSPADWQVTRRRHFPGYLMSVSPGVAGHVRGLFCLNERAVYLGRWRHGFFSFGAVGATNVGSINVYPDQDLTTNTSDPLSPFRDHHFPSPLSQARGQLFGEFDLGSTIVLVFEAPASFNFSVAPGQKVQVGQALGIVGEKSSRD